mmetsp:Transcript_4940/g.6422  ORF Transcript_4940/g.6422 Transcript_4940/m.6422 type:complete len:88 (-) Transcript_4940:586-849(-)
MALNERSVMKISPLPRKRSKRFSDPKGRGELDFLMALIERSVAKISLFFPDHTNKVPSLFLKNHNLEHEARFDCFRPPSPRCYCKEI